MVEMLVVIGIIGILAALLLPALAASQRRAKRIACESRLRQTGIGFQSFSHDHDGKFPMQVSTNDGGSLEYVQSGYLMKGPFYFGFRHFQPLAAVLETPQILVCPADTRLSASSFAALQNSNVSYFVAVNAEYSQPMSVLAGDGNLAGTATLVRAATGSRLTWTEQQHQFKGNVLFSDGHIEEWGGNGAGRLASDSDLVVPSLGGGGNVSGQSAAENPAHDSKPVSPANRAANTNIPPHSPTNPAAQPPASPTNPPATVPASGAVQVGVIRTGPQSVLAEVSNPPPMVQRMTNGTSGVISSPSDDDSVMSPFDRKLAKVLQHVMGWSYLLLLLLLIAYVAWRINRWLQEREQRRQK